MILIVRYVRCCFYGFHKDKRDTAVLKNAFRLAKQTKMATMNGRYTYTRVCTHLLGFRNFLGFNLINYAVKNFIKKKRKKDLGTLRRSRVRLAISR